MKKRILGIFLSAVMVAAAVPAIAMGAMNFTDVKTTAWYYNDVKTAYESGIIAGKSDTKFDPDANLTYAEAVKLAACMHQKYMTGNVTLQAGNPWYEPFVTYCKANSIIDKDYYWNDKATRGGYMEIFANALPDYALKEINTIDDDAIPDVSMKLSQADAIYKLYRAGVVIGVDDDHNCNSSSFIKRSEVSAIITRMMDASKRVELTLKNNGSKPKTEDLKIATDPKDITVKPGDDAKFTVKAEGGETPYEYEWHLISKSDGKDSVLKDSSSIIGSDTASLTSKNCKKTEDGDKYYCIVTDDNGNSARSNKAVLSVSEDSKELTIKTQPKDTTVDSGDDAVFSVKVSGGEAPYKYEWHRIVYASGNDEVLSDSSLVKGSDTNTVTVKNCMVYNDGDKFYCIVKDDNGDKEKSDKAELSVVDTFEYLNITSQPKSVTVSGTDTVTFSVKVSGGTPPYKYQWYKLYPDDTLITIPNNSYYSGATSDTLTVKNLTWDKSTDDGAKFYCVITDSDSDKITSKDAVVTVKSDPLSVGSLPANIYINQGDPVAILASATGGQKPYTYQWYCIYKGNTLTISDNWAYSGSNTETLQINTGTLADGLKYYCKVTDANYDYVTTNNVVLNIS
ncbi:MAG: S-layer homology domain-containing protein [Firmicutes bacterium]|nr:S-layer homology domain-containing protein [Bacillota bacterium]